MRLPSLAACLSLSLILLAPRCAAGVLGTRNTVVAAPYNFPANEYWDGIDGQWSSFTIQVGSPAQILRVLPSTSDQQVWVVQSFGCLWDHNSASCNNSRGGLFVERDSSTWNGFGIFDLDLDENLWEDEDAEYGFETVGLDFPGNGGPVINHTTVGAYAYIPYPPYMNDFWMGLFGLDPKPTNFSNFSDSTTSYMTFLKEQDVIPSLSFGYTAGAKYRGSGVLASLILGGYDQSLFHANNVIFPFGPDNSKSLLVAVQSVVTDTTLNGQASTLLSTGIYAAIDSSVTQIWLPIDACKAFEDAFGLTYNETLELYLLNDTQHEALLNANPTITFTLGIGTSGGSTVDIDLPYASFDLQATPPYHNITETQYYFPLRRAQNDTQYTLGRVFLQESYIGVDWERNLFNVSRIVRSVAPAGSSADIITVFGVDSATNPDSGPALSKGAIAGIVIGGIVVILLGFIAAFVVYRRKKGRELVHALEQQRLRQREAKSDGSSSNDDTDPKNGVVFAKPELDGTQTYRGHEVEDKAATEAAYATQSPLSPASPGWIRTPEGTLIPGSSVTTGSGAGAGLSPVPLAEAEASERQIYEMAGDEPAPTELPGLVGPSPKEEAIERERVYNGVDPQEE